MVFSHGRLVVNLCERNLWVTAGSNNSASLYGGRGGGPITQIGFGSNATPPASTDTALTDAYLQAIGAPSYPAAGEVTFPFTLASGNANGLQISEFGLLTAAGVLCARKSRSTPIIKSAAITLAGSWSIQF